MRHRASATAVVILAAAAIPAAGQVLRGQVLDAATDRGVSSADVALLDTLGVRRAAAVTDSSGAFRVKLEAAGIYRVRVERLGYRATQIDSIDIGDSEEVVVVLRVGVEAIPVAPIDVTGRSRFFQGRLQEFYERMDRNKRAGIGRFLTREEIENRPGAFASDLFYSFPSISVVGRQRTVTMRRNGTDCVPHLYLDGVLLNRGGPWNIDEFVRADDVEGVEVYHGLAQGPGDYHDPSGCGVVLVWTRRGSDDGEPFSWRRLLVATGFAGVLFLLLR